MKRICRSQIAWGLFMLFSFFSSSCANKLLRDADNLKPVNIIIQGLKGNCYSTLNGTNQVNYTVHVSVSNYRGTSYREYTYKDAVSSTGNPKFPLTITVNMYDNQASQLIVYVDATECSTCANNRSDAREITGTCGRINNPDGTVRAAKPSWKYENFITWVAEMRILPDQYVNVSNSCGCNVPL